MRGVRFAKYGGGGVIFAIYPSEKYLPKIGNVIHLQFTLCKIVDVFKILGCRLKICKIRRGGRGLELQFTQGGWGEICN